jgi:hypothetical protein
MFGDSPIGGRRFSWIGGRFGWVSQTTMLRVRSSFRHAPTDQRSLAPPGESSVVLRALAARLAAATA